LLKSQISRAELDRLTADIEKHANLTILEQGLEYQQKGFVYNTEVLPNRVIVSKVQGERVYDIKIDLDFFGLSECTCGNETFCAHMAATFFYVYAAYAPPDALVRRWKRARQSPNATSGVGETQPRVTAGLQPPKPPSPDAPEQSASAEQWHAFMAAAYDAYAARHGWYRYDPGQYFEGALESIGSHTRWWGAAARKLHAVHAVLFTLRKLHDGYGAQRHIREDSEWKSAAGRLAKKLDEAAAAINISETIASMPDRLEALASFVPAELLAAGQSPVDWRYVYRRVWTSLLGHPPWVEREAERLDRKLADTGLTGTERDALLLARGHMETISGADDRAWSVWNGMSAFHPVDAQFYVDEFARTGRWERLWRWLMRLLAWPERISKPLFQEWCKRGGEAAVRLNHEEEWIRLLASMLPRSYCEYTDFLIRTKRYRQWIDFHLAAEIDVTGMYAADLRAVEAHDPTLAFPLYHHAVERRIAQKNRTAYKESVRLLKKLGELYRQAGRADRFADYMDRLRQRYARLHAFQEELRKGKLV